MSSDPTSERPEAGAFGAHDHAACAAGALEAAERACAAAGARLTPLRRRVLELLWEAHKPVGAYRLLERLRAEGLGSQPPSVYRALDFLVEQGLAHKLRSQSAYLGCAHPGRPHAPHFLICRACEEIDEILDGDLAGSVERAALSGGFRPNRAALEIEGLCAACADRDAAAQRER